MMKKMTFAPVLAAALAVSWAALAFGAEAPASSASGIVARIGKNRVITERDLEDFTKSESCYGPDAINSRRAGFMRMLEVAAAEELLERQARIVVSPDDYEKELGRIDRETRAPEMLDCIKAYFQFDKATGAFKGDGRRRYERIFLRKNIVGRMNGQFYNSNPRVQGKAFKTRDRVLEKARKGASFADLAKEFNLEYSTRTFTLEEPKDQQASTAAVTPPFMRWSPFEKQFIEDNLKDLKPGEMKPQPNEDANAITFIKLLSQADGKHHFETLLLRKVSTGEYYKTIPKIPCRIYDADLKDWVIGIQGRSGLLQFE